MISRTAQTDRFFGEEPRALYKARADTRQQITIRSRPMAAQVEAEEDSHGNRTIYSLRQAARALYKARGSSGFSNRREIKSIRLSRPVFIVCLLGLLATPFSSAISAPQPENAQVPGDRRISLNMAKGEIRDALRLIAEQGGLNLVIGPGVKGDVSVYLTDASLETALRAITINNGFAFTVEDGIISVSKKEDENKKKPLPPMVTRVFSVQSQDAQRVRDALIDALSRYDDGRIRGSIRVLNENSNPIYATQHLNQLSGDFQDNNNGTTNGGTTGSISNADQYRGGTSLGNGTTGGSGVGLGTSNQSEFERARNARFLVVTDVKESVDQIADLIADLDRLPPQVLIEARIVEMSTDLQRQLGIDWDINILANGPILNHELPLQFEAGFATGSQIRRGANGSPRSSTGLSLGTIDFSNFTGLLRAHQGDNAIRLLANPRMLVFNNHSASILVGERYPLLQANITDFGTLTESFDTYIPVGVQLEVTPTIMMDGRISLMVHPATSSLGDDVVGTTGLRVARINTRELDTRVIMHDAQTIVLGGLISDRKTRRANKVPGLGDLPIFNIFFRQESPRSERVDLLVFLTTHVEGGTQLSQRDQEVFQMYRPHFKQIQRLQDVPLHFEIPTEYQSPKPMFGDPRQEEPSVSDQDYSRASSDPEGQVPRPSFVPLQRAKRSVSTERSVGHRGVHSPRFKKLTRKRRNVSRQARLRSAAKHRDARQARSPLDAHDEP